LDGDRAPQLKRSVMRFLQMNRLVKSFGFIVMGLSTCATCSGKEWRGIVPMHSTRADVNRLLGTSPDFNTIRAKYFLDNEDVYIVFSSDESYQACAKQLPKDTVLLIEVTPKTNLQLSDLRLDKADLRTFEPSSPPGIGYEGFIDDANGVVVRTFKGRVDQIAYVATSEDRKLCPEYYEHIEGALKLIVDFYPRKFDEYANIPFADEKERLDNLAIQLQNEPESVGYLIFFWGRNLAPAAAKARADRAKNYLATKRDMKRIVIVNGGRREEFALELYVQHRDLPPPMPYPDPNPKPRARITKPCS
jgi:hypothetical protein